MAGSTNSISNIGSFIGTTNIWDVSEIYSTDVNSEQFKELIVRLYQNVNNIAVNLNIKDTGYYPLFEFLNGQLFFPNPNQQTNPSSSSVYRQVYRTTVIFGALPNATTVSVPHFIPVMQGYTFTRIYGAASNVSSTSFLPLPYASPTLNQNISLNADNANVNITTAIDYSGYTSTYVVLEYIKQ